MRYFCNPLSEILVIFIISCLRGKLLFVFIGLPGHIGSCEGNQIIRGKSLPVSTVSLNSNIFLPVY